MREVRARVLAPVIAVLVSASAAVALSSAWTDDFDVAPAIDGGDGDSSSTERAACPKAPPTNGATCTLPEGTTCNFGQCAPVVQCTRGVWRHGASPSPKRAAATKFPEYVVPAAKGAHK